MQNVNQDFDQATRSKCSRQLLNNMTLRIRDPIIDEKFRMMRLDRFNSFFYPTAVICTIVFFGLLIQDVARGTQNTHAFGWLLPEIISLFYWLCCLKYKPALALYFIFLYMFLRLTLNMLIIWDAVAEPLFHKEPSTILITETSAIVFFFFLNYTTFLETLIAAPFILFIPVIISYIGFAKLMRFDPYSGKELDNNITSCIGMSIAQLFVLVVLGLGHLYYVQKDLILSVIDQHMIKQQQTQLREFFLQKEDAVIVATRQENSENTDERCKT